MNFNKFIVILIFSKIGVLNKAFSLKANKKMKKKLFSFFGNKEELGFRTNCLYSLQYNLKKIDYPL